MRIYDVEYNIKDNGDKYEIIKYVILDNSMFNENNIIFLRGFDVCMPISTDKHCYVDIDYDFRLNNSYHHHSWEELINTLKKKIREDKLLNILS